MKLVLGFDTPSHEEMEYSINIILRHNELTHWFR